MLVIRGTLSKKKVSLARLTVAMLVWLASIRPLTRWLIGIYGLRLVRATWMLAGPQGIKVARRRSRIRRRLLWTSVGSTSPWITFNIEM